MVTNGYCHAMNQVPNFGLCNGTDYSRIFFDACIKSFKYMHREALKDPVGLLKIYDNHYAQICGMPVMCISEHFKRISFGNQK